MEVETADFAEIDRTYRELETVNRLSLAYRPTLTWLDRAAARFPGERLSILDVACGHGDMSRRIAAWARRRGVGVEVVGLDISPDAVRSAEAATPAGLPVRYEVGDVFAMPDDRRFDLVVSALFAHHLFDERLVAFVAGMERAARRGWMINDLHRHAIPYHFTRTWFRLARFSRFMVNDGPVSIARGFTRAEWLEVLRQAGVDPALVEIAWCVPFRWRVARLK